MGRSGTSAVCTSEPTPSTFFTVDTVAAKVSTPTGKLIR